MAVKKIGTLNKHENPATNEDEFDIENYMNVNWDKIKEVVDNNADELTTAQQNIKDLEQGQGTASTDITSLKNRVTTLETDNTTNKQDISSLKSRTTTLETDNETNKTNISTLQEDVEEIESNITELQTEQTAQNKKIEQLDDNQIHITTEKAESINVQDASGQNAKIKLFGVSKQKTREGYNLLNIASKFEVKGRSNAIAISLKTGVTYTVKADNIETNNENSTTLAISFRTASDVIVRDLAFSYNSKKATFQVTKEVAKVYIYSADNYNNSQNITTTYTNLMIYEGTDDKEYEAYGASPSPEFPSQIQNTEGDVKTTNCNKNIANAEEIWENMHNYASSLCSEVIEDNKDCILFNNTAFRADLSTNPFNLIEYKFKENTAYTIRMLVKKINNVEGGTLYLEIYYTDGTTGKTSTDSSSWTELRLVSDSSKTISRIGFSYGSTRQYYLDKSSIFIAEVDTTDYIENEQQTMTFPLQKNQKMMEGSRTENDGIHHKRKQFNLSSLTNVSDWTNKGLNENGTYTYFTRATNLMDYKFVSNLKALCTHFEFFGTVSGTSAMQNKGVGCAFYYTNYNDKLFYINTTIATTEELVACLSAQETANTPVILEYETEEETIEEYTEEQQTAYNQLQSAKTYKTVTNVFTENAELEMEYIAHTKTYIDNEINSIKEQINTINELLSTTNTSAMLLDNMQTDLESEVL